MATLKEHQLLEDLLSSIYHRYHRNACSIVIVPYVICLSCTVCRLSTRCHFRNVLIRVLHDAAAHFFAYPLIIIIKKYRGIIKER